MACLPFNLRTDGLTGADTGGTWSLVAGSYSGVLSGDNPAVNISAIPSGTSATFRYFGNDCDGNLVFEDVTLYNMEIGTSSDNSDTICTNDSIINLYTFLSGNVGSNANIVWGGDVTTPPFSGTGTSATFNPALAINGTYAFSMAFLPSAPGGYADLGCCDPVVAIANITVSTAFNPGSGGLFAGC